MSSAFSRGINNYKNAEELARVAKLLVSDKDERTLAELQRHAFELLTAIPISGATPESSNEELAHLKKLGPVDLAREIAWRAEDQYGIAKRHMDISLIEMNVEGASVDNNDDDIGGDQLSSGMDSPTVESLINTAEPLTGAKVSAMASHIKAQRAAIKLFVDLQVPGPSYYRKRALSKGAESQPYFGIGVNGEASDASPHHHHHDGRSSVSPPPLPSSFFGGFDELLTLRNAADDTPPRTKATTSGPNSKQPTPRKKPADKKSGTPQSASTSADGGISDLWEEALAANNSTTVADDYLALLQATMGSNSGKSAASQQQGSTASSSSAQQQQQQQQQRHLQPISTNQALLGYPPIRPPLNNNSHENHQFPNGEGGGPVLGIPIDAYGSDGNAIAVPTQGIFVSTGEASVSSPVRVNAPLSGGCGKQTPSTMRTQGGEKAPPSQNNSHAHAESIYDPHGIYSARGRQQEQSFNYDPHGVYSQRASANNNNAHNYDPHGVYQAAQQQQRIDTPQPAPRPAPPPSSCKPHAQTPPPNPPPSTTDNYMELLSSALGGSGGKGNGPAHRPSGPSSAKGPSASKKTKEEEYLDILAQIAEKKKLQQPSASTDDNDHKQQKEGNKKEKENEKEPPKSAPPPPQAPNKPATTSGGKGGGGGAPSTPPPMSSKFKSLINDMANIGAVTGDGGHSDALHARNAAHSLSSAGANYAPKTSQFVLKGIDVSAVLMKQGQYKKSVDILQHVFDQGKLETHNTRNFESSMTAAIADARKRYYEHNPPRLLQVNPISDEEMKLLQDSGKTSTAFFPIWDDVNEGYAAENVYYPMKPVGSVTGGAGGVSYGLSLTNASAWEDPFSPHLSAKQIKAGAKLIRAPKVLEQFTEKDVIGSPPPQNASLNATGTDPARPLALITTCDPMSIKQTIVGDCSLVCSLIVCASYQQRFPQAKIISHVIFPQEEATAASGIAMASQLTAGPAVNPAGKYCIKMLVNGITRMVVIDDRLPAILGGNGSNQLPILACSYSTDPREMWVTLMEKAFVKVCGGTYDFPGSNSSTDLYHLSGWLPDYLACDSTNFNADLQWQRLAVQHQRGGLLATLNTPANMDAQTSDKLKLIPGHAYAILDMREASNKQKLVKIKNPWTKENSWEGRFSPKDTERMTPELKAELGFTDDETRRGVFWMCWEDVCRYFSRIHLSWNPYCLYSKGPNGGIVRPTRIARHAHWMYTNALTQKPQFDILAKNNLGRKTRLHLVLSRHIINLDEFNIKAGKRQQIQPDGTSTTNGLGVFDECPQGPGGGGNGSTGDSDSPDPSDYVPLITVHIYDTSAYPSIGQTVVSLEPLGSFCGGGKWPAEGSQALVASLAASDKMKFSSLKTPLLTVIERHPTIAGIVGVPSNTSTASKSLGGGGSHHMTESFTGRRIDNATQLPNNNVIDPKTGNISAYGTLIHNGVYKNVPHQTISFDCPPTNGTDMRRFTVVISQLLPKAERDTKPGSPRVNYPALRSFPFSLTLHSELPLIDKDTSAALLTRAVNLPQGIRDRSFINMTTMPTLGQLPFVTKAKGHWIGGMNCGGKVGTKTFGFNPQFLLTIPPPQTLAAGPSSTAEGASAPSPAPSPESAQHLTHLLATVTSQSAVETVQIHVVCLKDASAALITKQQRDSVEASASSSNSKIPPWYGRLYTITDEEAKFVLSCERYGWQSAAVDTSLSNCLQFDETETLKRPSSSSPQPPTPTIPSSPSGSSSTPPPMPTGGSNGHLQAVFRNAPPKLLPVALKVPTTGDASSSAVSNACYFFPFPRQKTGLVLLPLIADGVFVTPSLSRMVHNGQQIPLVGADGNPASAPSMSETNAAETLIIPSTVAIDARLKQVYAASGPVAECAQSTAKMMNNAGSDASIIKVITVIPAGADAVKNYLLAGGGDDPAVSQMKEMWEQMIVLAQRILAQFASWYLCGRWAEAVETLSPAMLTKNGEQRASISAANHYMRRRFSGTSDLSLAEGRRKEAEKAFAALNEEILQLITKIDKFGIDAGDEEQKRNARKALIAIAQHVLHEGTDELSKAFADIDQLERDAAVNNNLSLPPMQAPQIITPAAVGAEVVYPVVSAVTALNRLPPGQYVVAVSQWTSGTPAPFEIVIETEVPHILTELPPEGSDATPEAAPTTAKPQQNAVVGYKKWHNLTINGTFSGSQQGGFLRCSGMYERTIPLTSSLFQVYPSVCIFIPSAAAPATLAIRVIISPPADANDQERALPPGALASGQLLLFSEPPDGSAQLIADSGDEASANDMCLTVTNNKELGAGETVIKTLGNTKVLGSNGGCTRINLSTASFIGGRRYRLLLLLRPAVSFRGGAQLQYMTRVFSSIPGTTASLTASK